jgi:hypothetical protein
MRTNHPALWVDNSVANPEKSELERYGNKVELSNLMLRSLDDETR